MSYALEDVCGSPRGGGHFFPDLQVSFSEMLECFTDISTGYHFLMAGEAQVSIVNHSLLSLLAHLLRTSGQLLLD